MNPSISDEAIDRFRKVMECSRRKDFITSYPIDEILRILDDCIEKSRVGFREAQKEMFSKLKRQDEKL